MRCSKNSAENGGMEASVLRLTSQFSGTLLREKGSDSSQTVIVYTRLTLKHHAEYWNTHDNW